MLGAELPSARPCLPLARERRRWPHLHALPRTEPAVGAAAAAVGEEDAPPGELQFPAMDWPAHELGKGGGDGGDQFNTVRAGELRAPLAAPAPPPPAASASPRTSRRTSSALRWPPLFRRRRPPRLHPATANPQGEGEGQRTKTTQPPQLLAPDPDAAPAADSSPTPPRAGEGAGSQARAAAAPSRPWAAQSHRPSCSAATTGLRAASSIYSWYSCRQPSAPEIFHFRFTLAAAPVIRISNGESSIQTMQCVGCRRVDSVQVVR
ncbi:unnamed protein product [Urochloa humidicola]